MPFTPVVRRFLQDVFRPSNSLGKRPREADEENDLSTSKDRAHPNCLALQNEDVEEDAVVITALNVMPFCCHADLLTMSHEQLISVAETLNAKLPLALQINTRSSDSCIRNSIEVLVGIRRDVPPAPKAKRSLSMAFSSSGDFADASSTSHLSGNFASPLALRNSTNNALSNKTGTFRLDSLREEEEPTPSDRPQKRRRTIAASPIPTPAQRERVVTRSQSHRLAPLRYRPSAAHPASSRMLRTQNQRLPDFNFESAYKNVTTARGRGHIRSQSAILTSTPKAERPGGRRSSAIMSSAMRGGANISTSDISASTAGSLNWTAVRCGTRRRLDYSGCQSSDDAREVTSAIKDMSMTTASFTSNSDMDLTLG
ncbi:hypothetical protein NM688_g2649 [Phlebia brevispora]|uniref:Uncharacterized protein n=1 Tax=Phlebia brevispora TaxID=194682 RepID=A0ACC1T886_9APHY|nr:hypothetical protein NM688_g2649 [Phlebia brevispora]